MIFKNKDKIFRANSFSENFNDKILNFQSRGEITFVNLVSKQRAGGFWPGPLVGTWVPTICHLPVSHQLSAQNSIKIKIKQIVWKQKAHVLNTIFFSFSPSNLYRLIVFRSWLIIDLWLNHRFAWHKELNYLMLTRLFLFSGCFPIKVIPTKVNDFIKSKMPVCHN